MLVRVLFLFGTKEAGSLFLLEAVVSFICLIYVVTLINTSRPERFYMLWIDGLMLLKVFMYISCEILMMQ